MAAILCIETATDICSAAIAVNGKCLSVRTLPDNKRHSAELTLLISEVLDESNLHLKDLDAIALSDGPGSYTGLRVGASVAKGICYALSKPLISVSTLKSLAWPFKGDADYIMPMIDARRMEVYTCIYNSHLDRIKDIHHFVITKESLSQVASNYPALLICGNGSEKCSAELPPIEGIIYRHNVCGANLMCEMAFQKWNLKNFEDPAYYSPNYYKKPNITVSKKQILG